MSDSKIKNNNFYVFVTFLLAQKSNQKRAPESDYTPDSGWFPDLAFVLL